MAGLWEQDEHAEGQYGYDQLDILYIIHTKNYDHVLGTSQSFHIQLKSVINSLYFLRTP